MCQAQVLGFWRDRGRRQTRAYPLKSCQSLEGEEANMQVLHLRKDPPSVPLWRRSNLLLLLQVLTEKGLHHPLAQTNKSPTHGDVCISFLGYLEPSESTEPSFYLHFHFSLSLPTPLLPSKIHNPLP